MPLLSMFKGSGDIAGASDPDSKDDSDPDIGKCANSDRMAFAFSSLALVVLLGPALALYRLPSKLLQGIAQGYVTVALLDDLS